MAQRLTDTRSVNAAGVYDPAALAKWPEGGAGVHVSLSTGAAVARLRVWNIDGRPHPVVEFTLPVPAGAPNAGAMHDAEAVHSTWADFDWEVVSLTGGGTLTMAVAGVGV